MQVDTPMHIVGTITGKNMSLFIDAVNWEIFIVKTLSCCKILDKLVHQSLIVVPCFMLMMKKWPQVCTQRGN